MKAIIKLKSFPNHLGIPGHQGGSLPMGADKGGGEGGQSNTSIAALNAMFDANERVKTIQTEVGAWDSTSKRYYKLSSKPNSPPGNRKQYEDAMTKYYAAKENLRKAKEDLKLASKDTKAPGYGEWKLLNTEKAIGGGWRYYTHPDHPEYGKVGINHFGGWHMQHVAASSAVEYNGKQFEWSGSGARSAANKFVTTVFGI
jgi:hypothetical protein